LVRLPLKRGRRECRALDAPASRVCNGSDRTHTRQSGRTGFTRHSPRNGLRLIRTLPGDRACLTPSSAEFFSADLTPTTEASGPHDFAVRIRRPRLKAPSASTASRPALVTIAKRPSSGTGRRMYKTDLGRPASIVSENRNFFTGLPPAGKSLCIGSTSRPSAGNDAISRGWRLLKKSFRLKINPLADSGAGGLP
jgi:hypothetical protein